MFALPAPLVFFWGGTTCLSRPHCLGEVRRLLCLTHAAACLRGQHGFGYAGLFELLLHGGRKGMVDVAHAFGLFEERAALRVGLVQGAIILSQHMRDKGDKRVEVHVDAGAAIAIVRAHEGVPEEGCVRLERPVV